MRLPAVRSVFGVVLVGVLVAGCGGEGSTRPADPVVPGLLGMLAAVRGSADTRVAVEYGAPARVRELGERFRMLQGYGYGTIASSARLIDDAIGVDLAGFDQGIVVGQPPRWGALLLGDYDLGAVNSRLRGRGVEQVERDGGSVWTSGEDFEINLADGAFAGVVPTNEFNTVRTADGSFAFAPSAAGVEAVTSAGDTSLADDDQVSGIARCLGDVVAARIEGVGAGVREDGAEVLCLDADLRAVEEMLRGDVPSTGEAWDELLPGASVEEDGGLVRVTAPGRESEPVGRVLRAMMTGDLRGFGQ